MLDMEKHKERVKWFTNDRVGMFIHWGLYALIGKGEWLKINGESVYGCTAVSLVVGSI